jgi:hypothetical protein
MRRVSGGRTGRPLLLAALLVVHGHVAAAVAASERPARTLEFRYSAPDAGEVQLVWGVDGWQAVPEAQRPAGTVIRNGVMHTLMARSGDRFHASLRVDPQVAVDYGFLVARTFDGVKVTARLGWDGRKEFRLPPGTGPEVLLAKCSLDLFPSPGPGTVFVGLLCLLSAAGASFLIDFLVRRTPPDLRRRTVVAVLLVIVTVGIIARLAAAVQWNQDHANNPMRLIGDEPGFDSMARDLLDRHGFRWPGRVPLYPAWLAAVYGVSGRSLHAVPYFQSFLGLATIVLTFLLGRSIFGQRAGLMASFWASTSYVLVMQPLHILSEALYTPILLLVALALVRGFSRAAGSDALVAGFLIGVANLIRPALLLFPPLLGSLLPFVKEPRKMATRWFALCAVSFLVVLPWLVHNYVRYGAVLPLQTSNAILWQGSPEYYHLTHDKGYTYLRVWQEVLYGPGWKRNDPTSVPGDRYWTRRALRSILDEPGIYIRFAGEKVFTYWLGDPSADWGNRSVFSYAGLRQADYSSFAAVQLILARFLPIIAFASVIFLRPVRGKSLPLLILMGYFTLLHALTHAEARLSEPLQPLLLVVIAGAVVTIFDVVKGHAPAPD